MVCPDFVDVVPGQSLVVKKILAWMIHRVFPPPDLLFTINMLYNIEIVYIFVKNNMRL